MQIRDFTAIELRYFELFCNFDDDELRLFRLRSKGIPLERVAESMDISVSTAKRISSRVNKKIQKTRLF